MNDAVHAARARGALIIHAPSETMAFYAGTLPRQRVQQAPTVEPPEPLAQPEPPLPVDATGGGSDVGETAWAPVWARQHAAIEIDPECDGISDDGREVYSFLRHHGRRLFLIPARPPYVSHDEGKQLVVECIEKFWCPTVLSEDLLGFEAG